MPFRKKPVEVRAVQWHGDNWNEIAAFHRGDHFTTTTMPDGVYLNIATLEGVMQARPGDWIIEGVKREVYPCKPDIFEATYEPWIGNPGYRSGHSISVDGYCNMGCC
jgi:hypothetical protein